MNQEEHRRRADNLQSAAEKASGHVRTLQITLLSLGAYLAVAFGSTTHEQLLRAGPVNLPLLDVELPLVSFYRIAPFLFVLLHFNLLLQAHLLHDKLKLLHDNAFNRPNRWSPEDRTERARLDSFPFTQMLAADIKDRSPNALTSFMTWMTFAFLPISLLLVAQWSFLPYHDRVTTCWHRALIIVDLGLLLALWMKAADLSESNYSDIFWLFEKYIACQIKEDSNGETPTHVKGNWCFMIFTILIAIMFSFGLLTIPGERLDKLLGETKLKFAPRNLEVREANLVGSWPTGEQIKQYGEDLAWQNFGKPPNLRNRDLRYADLSRSILVRGDLRGAKLRGAILRSANLQSAVLCDENGVNCADLHDAVLIGARLSHAQAERAKFGSAILYAADLQGARASSADFRGADLTGADLRGADLVRGQLQGATLRLADVRGADLAFSRLQGADLSDASLQGVRLESAYLQGADLGGADLRGADLTGADFRGADLRRADLWRAYLSPLEEDLDSWIATSLYRADLGDRWALAGLRGVDVDDRGMMLKDFHAEMEQVKRLIADEATRDHVATRLRAGLRDDHRPEVPRFPKSWRSELKVMFEPDDPLPQRLGWGARVWATESSYDEDLAWFLGKLACKLVPVHVAQGLAGRALKDRNRLYATRLAARLTGDDCPSAAGLPDDLRGDLRRLADRL